MLGNPPETAADVLEQLQLQATGTLHLSALVLVHSLQKDAAVSLISGQLPNTASLGLLLQQSHMSNQLNDACFFQKLQSLKAVLPSAAGLLAMGVTSKQGSFDFNQTR